MEFVTLGNALNVALLLAAGLGWRWVDRIQGQQDAASKKLDEEKSDRLKFEMRVVEEFAKKTEVKGSRDEVLAQYQDLARKLDKLTDKLDGKKDKNDVL